MRREALRQFKNRNVVVTGKIEYVCFKNKLDREHRCKRNVKILLKNVLISGVKVDHVWLLEQNKYYDTSQEMLGHEVKFKAKVIPYVKSRHGIYVEDYGIERSSKLLLKEVYEKACNLGAWPKYSF
ncbi:hypothetical protein [Staphylococcus canis]|uniref:Transposase n=1 Tax=Staphylococcus canis TaxID=2724942 RepID=A0ABS0T6N1_9STAP|nr:hypothetical protein [Staphylococcus canis]MBI5974403.1 hypothetical protein [Staphylococcus canis]